MDFIKNNLASVAWFRPELVLTAGVLALILLDVGWKKSPARVAILTLAALAFFGGAAAMLAMQPSEGKSLFNGMIASDPFATFFKWIFLAAGFLTVTIAAKAKEFGTNRLGVFYALLLSVVIGMCLMASATDLLMLYLAVEMVSLPSYALVGYRPGDRKAIEASLKYVIYGGVASGIMLFGLSYIYGMTGSTSFAGLGAKLDDMMTGASVAGQAAGRMALVLSVIFVLCGIGYKIAAVPWHMWCPDVYEGAPTPFTAFLSVGPKAAGFALAIRMIYGALSSSAGAEGMSAGLSNLPWPAIVGILSAVTMSVGNLTAMNQTNLKRLLAYSSIAHAGYGLMGLAAASALGVQSIMIYMLIYLVMNLGAFLAVIVIAEATGGETVDDCKGLIRRHPLLAISFTIFLFSLTGLPPFAGFMGKWYLFAAILRRYGEAGGSWYIWLGIVAALNTAVALYYYVRIIRAMIIDEPKGEIVVKPSLTYQVMLGAFSLAILVFGLWWTPIATWTEQSLTFFRG